MSFKEFILSTLSIENDFVVIDFKNIKEKLEYITGAENGKEI